MSEQKTIQNVVKIQSAMSNSALYVKIEDPSMSIDQVVSEAIISLRNAGKPLESNQLEQLYHQHQIYSNGKLVQKGNLFNEIKAEQKIVGGDNVNVVSLDFISNQSGGAEMQSEVKKEKNQEIIPQVGMGVTEILYTDREPFTIIKIISPTRILIQADKVEPNPKWTEKMDFRAGGFCGTVVNQYEQEWIITPNSNGKTIELTKSKNGTWKNGTGTFRIGVRQHFYDYNF